MNSKVGRFATCSIAGCLNPSVRGNSCTTCKRHLCARHVNKPYHKCLKSVQLDDEAWEKGIDDEVSNLLAKINVPALKARASALHHGIPCDFEPGKHLGSGAMMGCANYHAWLNFDNGDRWLVRIPRSSSTFSDIPASLVEYLVASEYATLKFLEGTKVPAPRAFGYGLESSQDVNDVGVSFILLEALPGRPFEAYNTSSEHKDRVYDAVADILIELSKHPFPKAGSLSIIGSDGNLAIGPVASNRFVVLDRYGPFESTKEYFHDITEQYLDLIADGQIYPEYPVEAFLIYTILQEQVQDYLELGVLVEEQQFFIKHVDDKGDHLLVDEQGNLTGIIDWQFTRSAPALEAFGPSLFTADLDALYAGHSCITQDDRKLAACLRDKGATALADSMEAEEIARRFHFGLASHMSRIEVWGLIKGILATFSIPSSPNLETWKTDAVKKYSKDPRLIALIQQQC